MNNHSLYPFQCVGVERLLSSPRLGLFDEMGLGKTVQSLSALGALKDPLPCIVVCPKALLSEWIHAIRLWLPQWRPYRADRTDAKGWELLGTDDGLYSIGVVSYSSLHKVLAQRDRWPRWGAVIFDEAHYLKNRGALRSRRARELARSASRVWLLTGTPPLYRAEEMWHLLHLLNPSKFRSYWRFFETHVKYWRLPSGARIPTGIRDPEMFADEVGPYVLLRKKADVLPELPPLIVSDVPVELLGERRRIYDSVLKGQLVDPAGARVSFPNALARVTALRKVATSPYIALTNTDRDDLPNTALASDKIDTLLEKIPSACCDQFVVFTHFRRTKELVTGRLQQRDYIVADVDHLDSWLNGAADVLVDTYYKGGLGLNLQQAGHAFFIEPPNSWTFYQQSLHRFQRPEGKQDSYHVWRIFAENTVDQHLFDLLDELGGRAEQAELALAAWRRIEEGAVNAKSIS